MSDQRLGIEQHKLAKLTNPKYSGAVFPLRLRIPGVRMVSLIGGGACVHMMIFKYV